MSVLTTVGVDQSIRNGWGLVRLFYFDHPDGEVYGWSGAGSLSYGGNTYLGVGPFVSIKGIGGDEQLKVREITFELLGNPQLDEDDNAFRYSADWINKNISNRVGRCWIAGLDASGANINGTPWLIAEGLGDYQELEITDDRTAIVRLVASEPVFSIERAQNLKFTPEWVNSVRKLDGDRVTGLDLLSDIETQVESWTRT